MVAFGGALVLIFVACLIDGVFEDGIAANHYEDDVKEIDEQLVI